MRSLSSISNLSLSCALLLVAGTAQGQTISPSAPRTNQPVTISLDCSGPGGEIEIQLSGPTFYEHGYTQCPASGPAVIYFSELRAGMYSFIAQAAPGNPDKSEGGNLNFTVVEASSGGINPGVSYNIVNQNNGLCMTSFGAAPIAGNPFGNIIFQNACTANLADQQWQFQPTDSGYYTVQIVSALGFDLDVENQSVENRTFVHLWKNYDLTNQQWMPVALGNGLYKLVGRASGRCLNVPGADKSVENLQIYDCNGTQAQSYYINAIPTPAK